MGVTAHELLIEVFRDEPKLVVDLVRDRLGLEVPEFSDIEVIDSTLAQVNLVADLAVVLRREGQPVLALALEMQLRPDEKKRYSWPLYAASLRSRHRCPAAVLVVTPDAATAVWARQPIELGFGSRFTPIVLGPASIPRVTEPAQARSWPALAFLSVLTFGRDAESAEAVARAALLAVAQVPEPRRRKYVTLVRRAVSEAVWRALEAEMAINWDELYEETSQKIAAIIERRGEAKGLAIGEARGEARGRAASILDVLQARGVSVPDELRGQVLACTDETVLARWLRRAVAASSAAEVFAQDD